MADDQIQVVFGADVTNLESGSQRGAQSVSRFADRMRQTSGDTAGLKSAIDRLTDSLRSTASATGNAQSKAETFIARLKEQAATVNMTRAELLAFRAAQVGATAEAEPYIAAIAAASHAHGAMSGTVREGIVVAREAINGNYTRMAGSLSILAQRSGLLAAIMSPLGLAITGVAVAAGGFAFAMMQGEKEMEKFADTMKVTDNYAGISTDAFIRLGKSIGQDTGVGAGKAKDALMQLAGTGKFTGEAFKLITVDAIQMATLTGGSTEDMLKYFEQMSGGVTNFAVRFSEQYGHLTTAQVDYIRKLEEQGDKEGAELALAKDIYGYFGGKAPEQLNALGAAWKELGDDIGGAWEALKGFGRDKTEEEKLAVLQAQLATARAARSGGLPGRGGGVNNAQAIADIQAQVDAQQRVVKGKEDEATAAAHASQVRKDGIDAGRRQAELDDQIATKAEKRKKDEDEVNKLLNARIAAIQQDATMSEKAKAAAEAQERAHAAREIAGVDAKYADKTRRPKADPSQIPAFEEGLNAQNAKMEADNGGVLVNMEAQAIAYWRFILDTAKLSEKDRIAVENKIATATLAYNKQATAEVGKNAQAAAQIQIRAAEEVLRETKKIDDDKISEIQRQAKDGIISQASANAQITALIRQRAADEIAIAKMIADAEIKTDDAVLAKANSDTPEYQEAYRKRWAAVAQYSQAIKAATFAANEDILTNTEKTTDQMLAKFKAMGDGISKSFAQTTTQLIMHQTTWQKVGQQIESQMLLAFIQTQAKRVADAAMTQTGLTATTAQGEAARAAIEHSWLGRALALFGIKLGAQVANQTAQTGATAAGNTARASADATGAAMQRATNAATVTSNAAVAGSGAAAAVAATPFIGPELALTEGAATMASVEGMFGSVAFAAQGWGEVPYDNMPTLLHKKEMVLPAQYATPLRAMLSSMHLPNLNQAAQAAAPLSAVSPAYGGGQGSAGNTHLHVSAMDQKGVQRFFDQHADKMARALQRTTRNNKAAFA